MKGETTISYSHNSSPYFAPPFLRWRIARIWIRHTSQWLRFCRKMASKETTRGRRKKKKRKKKKWRTMRRRSRGSSIREWEEACHLCWLVMPPRALLLRRGWSRLGLTPAPFIFLTFSGIRLASFVWICAEMCFFLFSFWKLVLQLAPVLVKFEIMIALLKYLNLPQFRAIGLVADLQTWAAGFPCILSLSICVASQITLIRLYFVVVNKIYRWSNYDILWFTSSHDFTFH